MPELPEVQTVVNTLEPQIKNKKLLSYSTLWKRVNYSKNSSLLNATIKNQAISNILRKGKYIIIKTNKYFIIFHLRMTGYLYYSKKLTKNKYIRCYFSFTDNTYLIYEDIRKFGGFYYLKDLTIIDDKLGIDALDDSLTYSWLKTNLKNKKRQIKGLLLDQSFIAGLGNIYIDEVLWLSQIHPLTISNKIKLKNIKLLTENIKSVLYKSIKHHGTTIINFKFDNMRTGEYRNKLNVYGRNGEECNYCIIIIDKAVISGRGTYYCKTCQRY